MKTSFSDWFTKMSAIRGAMGEPIGRPSGKRKNSPLNLQTLVSKHTSRSSKNSTASDGHKADAVSML